MKQRRTRSPHPGVVLLKPDPEHDHPTWRARFVDPDSGRQVKVRLDPAVLRTVELRREWAIKKSRAIAKRAMELDVGAPRATGTLLADGLARYFSGHPQLRAKTLLAYKGAGAKLLEWAEATGLRNADDLTRAKLLGFREQLVNEPKRVAARSARRGARRATPESRSAHSVNRELRATRTMLGYLCDLDLFPRLTHDDLRRALKRVEVTVERVEYLRSHELQKLLEAALRYDATTFAGTREELAGLRLVGSTPRYTPIAFFVAFVLLTGMRLGEALNVVWGKVDLDALDAEGRRVGEVHLTGATKTKHARTVGLEVSPALHRALSALRLATGGKGSVFGLTPDAAKAAALRLKREFGAPASFSWQGLRRTCGTFLTNAPGIFGAASAYRSAKQLGHSVAIAERHYVGLVRGIPRDARTLEAAMQIEEQLERVIEAIGGRELGAQSRTQGDGT